MGDTKIAWTNETWNPVTGCTPVSEGCANCYAASIAKRFWGERKFSDVRFHEARLNLPNWRKPRMVFVGSMSDLFHEQVTDEQRDTMFNVMLSRPQHTFQVLTKRIERAAGYYQGCIEDADEFDGLPSPIINAPNIWLGVTCENQEWADKRIPILLNIPAAVRFVSLEPLLGPVDLTKVKWARIDTTGWPFKADAAWSLNNVLKSRPGDKLNKAKIGLDWVIIGCESGPRRRPCEKEWVCDIVRQCHTAGVPVFVKQMDLMGPKGRKVVHDADLIAYELGCSVEDIRQWPKRRSD